MRRFEGTFIHTIAFLISSLRLYFWSEEDEKKSDSNRFNYFTIN